MSRSNPLDALPSACSEWLANRRIEEVECVVSDLAGIARGKAMPWKKFTQTEQTFMPVSIFYQTITGQYTEIEGLGEQWTERDMALVPDITTATSAPWSNDITIQVIHDMKSFDGEPISVSPRNVLKRVLGDEYGAVIDDIYDFAEAQGFGIETIIQEGGAGQIEINVAHGDPLQLADQSRAAQCTSIKVCSMAQPEPQFSPPPMAVRPHSLPPSWPVSKITCLQ